MPDENKLQALRDAGFNVMSCCMLCKHFTGGSHSVWGACEATTYDHLKHSEKGKAASVPSVGWCPSFERKEAGLSLNAHEEFFRENEIKTTLHRFTFYTEGWNVTSEYEILAENEEQAREILKKAIPLHSKKKCEDYTMSWDPEPDVVELVSEPGVIDSHWHGDAH
jgi:hypothetical protein